jgi:hypothetical protein
MLAALLPARPLSGIGMDVMFVWGTSEAPGDRRLEIVMVCHNSWLGLTR